MKLDEPIFNDIFINLVSTSDINVKIPKSFKWHLLKISFYFLSRTVAPIHNEEPLKIALLCHR